ncbi:hypothetical protein F5Y10DRAFT_220116 [Nemania abortiva]|nr:hypothetical protein F5Y10DRAFT_220116 [Nemania abortiva]
MQVKALIISLFLAASVAAAPTRPKSNNGLDLPTTKSSFGGLGIGNDNHDNPAIGNGNDNASHNGNGSGDGNSFGSNNKNEFLNNDSLNFSYGANSRQISEKVVAAMKSLTMTCISSGEGVMSCTWKS